MLIIIIVGGAVSLIIISLGCIICYLVNTKNKQQKEKELQLSEIQTGIKPDIKPNANGTGHKPQNSKTNIVRYSRRDMIKHGSIDILLDSTPQTQGYTPSDFDMNDDNDDNQNPPPPPQPPIPQPPIPPLNNDKENNDDVLDDIIIVGKTRTDNGFNNNDPIPAPPEPPGEHPSSSPPPPPPVPPMSPPKFDKQISIAMIHKTGKNANNNNNNNNNDNLIPHGLTVGGPNDDLYDPPESPLLSEIEGDGANDQNIIKNSNYKY